MLNEKHPLFEKCPFFCIAAEFNQQVKKLTTNDKAHKSTENNLKMRYRNIKLFLRET